MASLHSRRSILLALASGIAVGLGGSAALDQTNETPRAYSVSQIVTDVAFLPLLQNEETALSCLKATAFVDDVETPVAFCTATTADPEAASVSRTLFDTSMLDHVNVGLAWGSVSCAKIEVLLDDVPAESVKCTYSQVTRIASTLNDLPSGALRVRQ